MVSWRAGLGLLVVLVALGALAVLTRPQPASRAPAPAFLGCSGRQAVDILIAGGGRVTELERHAPGDSWRVAQPGPSAADSRSVETLVSSIDSIKVLNTIGRPQPAPAYGLDHPREVLTCRVTSGRSYNLSVGNLSFDGSGYYAEKSGDSRVYVISSVEVDEFDRTLAEPPVTPAPSPTT